MQIFNKFFLKIKAIKTHSVINAKRVSTKSILGNHLVIKEDVIIMDDVQISDYIFINTNTKVISANIGKYVSIGCNCIIGPHEHPYDFFSVSPYIYSRYKKFLTQNDFKEITNPPIIGNDVWIGCGVIILQGVSIGDGAIIGAGSVVTKDIPAYQIAIGNPAKVIKPRFSEVESFLLKYNNWWDYDQSYIDKLVNDYILKM